MSRAKQASYPVTSKVTSWIDTQVLICSLVPLCSLDRSIDSLSFPIEIPTSSVLSVSVYPTIRKSSCKPTPTYTYFHSHISVHRLTDLIDFYGWYVGGVDVWFAIRAYIVGGSSKV